MNRRTPSTQFLPCLEINFFRIYKLWFILPNFITLFKSLITEISLQSILCLLVPHIQHKLLYFILFPRHWFFSCFYNGIWNLKYWTFLLFLFKEWRQSIKVNILEKVIAFSSFSCFMIHQLLVILTYPNVCFFKETTLIF